MARDPNVRIMLDSETYNNSKNFLREIKGHIESERFQSIWGNWVGPVWNEAEIVIDTRTKVLKESTLFISAVESSRVGSHCEVIVMDDLCSEANMLTEEVRNKVISHYRMNTAILEPHGTMVVVGTRYHSDDVIGHILRSEIDESVLKDLGLADY